MDQLRELCGFGPWSVLVHNFPGAGTHEEKKTEGKNTMPFTQQRPRAFNRFSIERITPDTIGVYGLFKGNVPIYIGRGDLRQRLLDHLSGDNPCITQYRPTSYVDEITSQDEARERELILEYDPVCNQRAG